MNKYLIFLCLWIAGLLAGCRHLPSGQVVTGQTEKNNHKFRPMILEVETVNENTEVFISIADAYQHKKFDHNCIVTYNLECVGGKQIKPEDSEFIHCMFQTPGIHNIKLSGNLHGIKLIDHHELAGYDDPYYFTDIQQWGDISWHDLSYFADNCMKLVMTATDAPDLHETISIERMLSNTNVNANINHWDVSHVENMSGLLLGNEVFNQPLDKWNTSNVSNMRNMFLFAKSFNQPIDTWNVSRVTNMEEMFFAAERFNQPLSSWDVSSVHYMNRMFIGANAFHQDISGWDFSGIEDCLDNREYYGEYCITYMFS